MSIMSEQVRLADAIDAPPIARSMAEQIERHAADIRLGPGDWSITAAARILAFPELQAGLKAAPIVAQLRARHRPQRWSPDSDVVVCSCGAGDYDACPDRRILDGQAP